MPTFIGFERLTDLVDEAPPFGQYFCYVSTPEQVSATDQKFGLQWKTTYLSVQLFDPQFNIVRYYRVKLGILDYIGVQPTNPDSAAKVTRRAKTARTAIVKFLESQGYRIREGVVIEDTGLMMFVSMGKDVILDLDTDTVTLAPDLVKEAA